MPLTGPEAAPGPDGDHPIDDARPAGRNRTARFAGWATAVLVVVVVVLLIYALTDQPGTHRAAHPAPVPHSVLSAVGSVPASVFDAVGVTSPATPLTAPTVVAGPVRLRADGKPEVFWAGAEYCPFCAAERWPLVLALSRFGHFTTLDEMVSSPSSAFPALSTFTFQGVAYQSPYLTLTAVELFSDGVTADGSYARIARLTPAQAVLVSRYGTSGDTIADLPFVDIGGRMVATTSGFSPALLVGQSQSGITAELTEPSKTMGRAVVASANALTAGMCAATDQQPVAVCASPGVLAADRWLRLDS